MTKSKKVRKEFEMIELTITITPKFYDDLEKSRAIYNEQYKANLDISEYLECGYYDLLLIIQEQAKYIKKITHPKTHFKTEIKDKDVSYQ